MAGKAQRSKIVFFEVEDWEHEVFAQHLAPHESHFFHDPLDLGTVHLAADAAVVSVFVFSSLRRDILDRLPRLRLIATRSTGFDHVDVGYCTAHGIVVSNVPRYGENTVAEHTFGLILALSRNIYKAYVRTARGDFSLAGLEGFDLKGKTLGVIGAGNIGLHVIRIAKGFGMRVIAYDVRRNELMAEVLGFEYRPLPDLLAASDVITLHAPLMKDTYHLINRDNVKQIKRGALLINTARGGLVDTEALLEALDSGILVGAGLDVLEGEELIKEEKQLLSAPLAEEKLRLLLRQHLLTRRDDVVITPHIAFYSREALRRIVDTTIDNIISFLAGHPQHVVNPDALVGAQQRAAGS